MNMQELIKRNMPVFVIGGLTILVFFIIILTSQRRPSQESNLIKVDVEELIAIHTYTKGPSNAPVKIVEFSDFGCPACKSFQPYLDSILEDYPDTVSLSFRHFPLPIHRDADKASIAAQVAGEQGKFWEYATVLYANQGKFDNASLATYADLIGLDLEQFKKELKNKTYAELVKEDQQYARQIGIDSTPTFFVNGKQLELQNYEDLRAAVEDALAENEIDPKVTAKVAKEKEKNELEDKMLEEVGSRFPTLEIEYNGESFFPRNTQASAGQLVRWKNNTDKDITFVQLMPKFDEFKEPITIKAGETLEFRIRLREMGLWTYKAEGDVARSSILINKLPPDLEEALPQQN